ncbi:MAG: Npt1/Npt2 family nucleotide transporter, partial [Chlamydiota bacterium]|nr:Npt1/Npt2 family nucleotide transporter [Chlamydiota bacterium]
MKISNSRLASVCLLFLVYFLITFNYGLLKLTNDALVITLSGGSHVLPFVKLWLVLPMTCFAIGGVRMLFARYSLEKSCYLILVGFIVTFAIFTFCLYPMRDYLQPALITDQIVDQLPKGWHGLITMLRHWIP